MRCIFPVTLLKEEGNVRVVVRQFMVKRGHKRISNDIAFSLFALKTVEKWRQSVSKCGYPLQFNRFIFSWFLSPEKEKIWYFISRSSWFAREIVDSEWPTNKSILLYTLYEKWFVKPGWHAGAVEKWSWHAKCLRLVADEKALWLAGLLAVAFHYICRFRSHLQGVLTSAPRPPTSKAKGPHRSGRAAKKVKWRIETPDWKLYELWFQGVKSQRQRAVGMPADSAWADWRCSVF